MDTLLCRLLERTHFEPNTGCWLWEGSDSGNGYGKIRVEGVSSMVHRVGWRILRGPICPTFVLDHRCRCRACWNPDHLRPMTIAVNTAIGEAVLFKKLFEKAMGDAGIHDVGKGDVYDRVLSDSVPAGHHGCGGD